MQDVGLVIDDQDPEALRLVGWRDRGRGPRSVGTAEQLDGEGRAGAGGGIEGDASAVLLHDALADRQSEAGAAALRLGGEKRLEHTRLQLVGNPRSVVRDGD